MTVNLFVGSRTASERRYNTSKNSFQNSSIKRVRSMQKNDTNHTKLGTNSSAKRDNLKEDCGMDETRNQVLNSK